MRLSSLNPKPLNRKPLNPKPGRDFQPFCVIPSGCRSTYLRSLTALRPMWRDVTPREPKKPKFVECIESYRVSVSEHLGLRMKQQGWWVWEEAVFSGHGQHRCDVIGEKKRQTPSPASNLKPKALNTHIEQLRKCSLNLKLRRAC